MTDRKRAEEALRRNEERLKMALEAATAGTWDWDLPSGDMEWSPGRIHASDRERVARTMREAMDRGASYELHPARLQQLGLEQSVRSFCEELTAARSCD